HEEYYVPAAGMMLGLFFSVLVVRADIIHFMYLAPFWYIAIVWILDGRLFESSLFVTLKPVLTLFMCATFGLMSLVILLSATGAPTLIATRRGLLKTTGQDSVLAYLETQTRPGDRILVYPYLPLYYYLSATHSPAPLDYFQPGMNTPDQGRQIVNSL